MVDEGLMNGLDRKKKQLLPEFSAPSRMREACVHTRAMKRALLLAAAVDHPDVPLTTRVLLLLRVHVLPTTAHALADTQTQRKRNEKKKVNNRQ